MVTVLHSVQELGVEIAQLAVYFTSMACRYGVLLWGANSGGVPRTIEGMFDAFSASVRMASGVPHLLPQV